MVGSSDAHQRLLSVLRKVAPSEQPALVVGPTGAGKEGVVHALHALGRESDTRLEEVNCGAIPEHLMESHFFGHERGAFTGAERRQEGVMKTVGQGTLFLDEIAELPLSLQAKLLRVLEARRFRPIGATAEQPFHGRVVAATHADLEDLVRQRRFRQDLYFRLAVLEVRVPSLEERREDIPELLAHFVQQQQRPLRFSAEAMDLLKRMPWPGNVRELRNLVHRLGVFAETDEVTPAVLAGVHGRPSQVASREDSLKELVRTVLRTPDGGDKLERLEQAMISEAMTLADGNKSAAARLLGVHRKSIERRLDRKEDEPLSGPED